MPIDPSISLQAKGLDLNQVGSYLDLGSKKLALQRARATFDSDVAQRQAESRTAQAGSQVAEANVQPLIQQQLAQTDLTQTGAKSSHFKLTQEQGQAAMQQAGGILADPRVASGNADDAMTAVLEAKQRAIDMGVPKSQAEVMFGRLLLQAHDDPKSFPNYLQSLTKGGMSPGAQVQAATPNVSMIPTQGGTQPFNTNANAPGGIGPVGKPLSTPNQFMSGPNGGTVVANPTTGTMQQPVGVGQDAPQPIPANETPQTMAQLQGERTAAQQAILQAPQMHNINQEISRIADTDVTTGKLGEVLNKVASATGYTIGAGDTADYNTLGKMLARSNATLAASMPGPHTNAGLEQTNAANGSPAYDKVTLKKIANLNDALVTGTELYQRGLENAVKQNGIFGKRAFDQAWAGAMDIDALRFKNAVDNGNPGEMNMILKTVGGKGSPGAKKLLEKLGKIDALAGQ